MVELIGYTYISPGLLRAFYIWLMVFATGSALLLNWPWITRWWTAERRAQEAARLKEIRTFRGLAEELRHARAKIRNHLASGMRQVSVDSEISSMWIKLKSLGINCPPSPFATDNDTEKALRRWGFFLNNIVPMAEFGHLDQARELESRVEGKLHSRQGDGTVG